MNRTALNATEKSQVATSYNSKGQIVDPDTRQPLVKGKMDIGHRYGYEHRALVRCAERCHMTQAEFNQMIKENVNRIFHWQDRTQNRNHSHECKDRKVQIRKCMELIRSFKYKNSKNNKLNKQSSKVRNSKSTAKARATKGMKIYGYEQISIKANGNKLGARNNSAKGNAKSGAGAGKSGFGGIGAKTSSAGAGKGGISSGGKGASMGNGGKGGSVGGGKGK